MVHAFIIEPTTYNAFESEAEQIDKCKEWGLLSEKAVKTKTFFYKRNGAAHVCSLVGYVDKMTAVIEFENKQKHSIHPSYLKEMQAANYGQKQTIASDEPDEAEADTAAAAVERSQEAAPAVASKADEPKAEETKVEAAPKKKAAKEKAPKVELPEEKVKMTATVQEFTTVPNHFSDADDEVIIYEAVSIEDPAIELGTAWSSHSATLKKLELAIGDVLTFEGKIVAKKLTKHPVPYKINNPAKLQKVNS
ncbi:hypothetical protein [Paenibacillus aestuarii]|uniref:Uncharacterized protein n=1 Tax=Paenibacillus aestuarii TaxID=516965 RepID=A0ABW0K1M8_9BACL|nr:hypothetical protein [Paenibacillus aestuarii]